jgi:serine/threonine protein kinase
VAANRTDDRVVADRYVRLERLGHGGFGVVWRAHDSLLQRDVAIKEIHFPEALGADERAALRERVLREARAAARLNHPGAVTVFDVVEEDDRPVIVMELVDAPTLDEVVERNGPLDVRRAAAIGLSALEALTAAHEHGIVHRDVKPANVMVHPTGRVQLADFGIASIIDDPKVTSSGQLAGSPSYMAPEQAGSRSAGPATDLWGLGATLYYAVEGRPPFEKDAAISTLASVVTDEPRRMERAGALAPLLSDLLVKDPARRPTAGDVARRLVEIADGHADPSPTAELDLTVAPAPTALAPTDPTPTPPQAAGAAPPSAPAAAALPPPSPPPPAAAPPPSPPAAGPPPSPPVATAPPPPAATPPPSPPQTDSHPPPPPAAAPPAEPLRPPPPASASAGIGRPKARERRPMRGPLTPASQLGVPLAFVAILLVVGLVILVGARANRANSGHPSGNGTPAATAAVPADWVSYRDPSTGFTISHPPTWTVTTNGTLTDIRDPATDAYLRIDHVQPPGPSPEGAWETYEPSFAAANDGYQRIQITPTTFKGYRAAIWEYTYVDGVPLHAVDLGFVAGSYGFALNFQTHSSDWVAMQPYFEHFKGSFQVPS